LLNVKNSYTVFVSSDLLFMQMDLRNISVFVYVDAQGKVTMNLIEREYVSSLKEKNGEENHVTCIAMTQVFLLSLCNFSKLYRDS